MENVILKARRDSTDAVAVTPPTDGPHPVVRGKITYIKVYCSTAFRSV